MVALVQRVKSASVSVDGNVVGKIEKGLLIFLGIHVADTEHELGWVTKKCTNLRIFPDEEGLMNRSVLDVKGDILVVSQFTLYGNVNKGNRPSFVDSAPPEVAEVLYEKFIGEMENLLNRRVASGVFGAMMDVSLVNDGPVTLWVEKKAVVEKKDS